MTAWRSVLGLIAGLSLVITVAVGATGAVVQVSPLIAAVELSARRPLTCGVEVQNNSRRELSLLPTLLLPSGWQEIVPPQPLHLVPGETQVTLFTFVPPATATAGDYTVRLEYKDTESPVAAAEFLIRILAAPALAVSLFAAPSHAVGDEPYQLEFLIQNTGNVCHRVHLHATDNLGLPMTVTPNSLDLSPGASAVATLQVSPPPSGATRSHRLELLAVDEVEPKIQAKGRATVELIPAVIDEGVAHHRYPLQVVLGAQTDGKRYNWSWSVSGRGKLRDTDQGEVALWITERRQLVSYIGPTYRVLLGDQVFSLSALTLAGVSARGIEVDGGGADWGARVLAYNNADGNHLGLRVSYHLCDQVELTVNHLLTPEGVGNLTSLGATVDNLIPGFGATMEYGLQAQSGEETAHAWRLSGSYVTAGGKLSATWLHNEAGYLGASRAGDTLRLSQTLALGAVKAAWQGNYQARYLAGPGTEIARRDLTLSGSLRGRIGQGNWTLAARRRQTAYPILGREIMNQSVYGSWSQTVRKGHVLSLRVGATQRRDTDPVTEVAEIPYRVSYSLPLAEGTLRTYLSGCSGLRGSTGTISGGLEWGRSKGDRRSSVRVSGDFGTGKCLIQGNLACLLPSGHSIRVTGRCAWTQGDSDWTFTVDYRAPINLAIPLGPRSDIGAVRGQIHDEAGNPVAGILVRLGGQVLRTQVDGSFRFPAVPAGDVALVVSAEELGWEYMLWPPVPYLMTIAAGETAELELQLIRVARLQGNLVMAPPSAPTWSAGAVFGPRPREPQDVAILNGMIIELSREGETHRYLIQVPSPEDKDSAAFYFDRLYPGTWILSVHRNRLPDTYTIEPLSQTVELRAGEMTTVTINIVPQERPVRFLDAAPSGVLSAPAATNGGEHSPGRE